MSEQKQVQVPEVYAFNSSRDQNDVRDKKIRDQVHFKQPDLCLGSYQAENTGSRSIPEVKQPRAESVLGRETAWEHSVS